MRALQNIKRDVVKVNYWDGALNNLYGLNIGDKFTAKELTEKRIELRDKGVVIPFGAWPDGASFMALVRRGILQIVGTGKGEWTHKVFRKGDDIFVTEVYEYNIYKWVHTAKDYENMLIQAVIDTITAADIHAHKEWRWD